MSDDGEYYDDGPDEVPDDDYPAELAPCNLCGRRFRTDVLPKHTKACQKLQKRAAQRKVFDSSKQRAVVTGDVVIPVAKLTTQVESKKPVSSIPQKKKSNWRQKSEEFRAIMRAGRGASSDDPSVPMPAFTRDDMVECQYCGRKFSESAAERHVKFCEQQHQRKGHNADEVARERMNARVKYQPPKLKSRTAAQQQEDDRLLRRPQQSRVDAQMTRTMTTLNDGVGPQSNSAPAGSRMRRGPFDPRTYEDSANGVGHIPLQVSSNQYQYGQDSAYSTMQNGKPPTGSMKPARGRASNVPSGIPKPSFGYGNQRGDPNGTPTRSGVRSRTPSPAPGPRGRQGGVGQNGVPSSPQRGGESATKRDFVTSKILARVNVKHRTASDESDGDEQLAINMDGLMSKQAPQTPQRAKHNGNSNGNGNGYSNGNGNGHSNGYGYAGRAAQPGRNSMNGAEFSTAKANGSADGVRPMPKFCHECGFTFPIPQAKFCCECGARRIVIGAVGSD